MIDKSKGFGGIIAELKADNKKKGPQRGQGGKPRSDKQIKAIAISIMVGPKKKK